MEDSQIKELIRERDHYKQKLERMQRNNRFATYLVVQGQIDSFNEQLTIRTEVKPDGQKQKIEVFGYIDLFASKDSKEFDRARWFFENYLLLMKSQDALYKMLTEEEQKEADGKAIKMEPVVTDFDQVRIAVTKKLEENKNATGDKPKN